MNIADIEKLDAEKKRIQRHVDKKLPATQSLITLTFANFIEDLELAEDYMDQDAYFDPCCLVWDRKQKCAFINFYKLFELGEDEVRISTEKTMRIVDHFDHAVKVYPSVNRCIYEIFLGK